MKIKTVLSKLKRKLFATYEYNESIAEIEGKILTLNELVQRQIIISENQARLSASLSRRTARSSGPLRCLFVVNNLNAWHAIDALVRKMSVDDDIDVIVVSANKRFPGQEGYSGESEVHAFLDSRNIHHIRLGMSDSFQALEIIMALLPDVIFRQSQWDVDYPPGLSSENLNFTRLAIVPYGICNIVENVTYTGEIANSAVDSLFHRRCWRVYCSTASMLAIAQRESVLQGRPFRVVGHPKVDYLLSVRPHWPFGVSHQHKVLWSPHHSITQGWTDFGLFPAIWQSMLTIARALTEVDFVFCPHPALMTQLTGDRSPVPAADVEDFIRQWSALPNCHQYYGAEYAAVAAASDLIVTDGISMLLEGQLLKKEIVFTEREGHAPFNRLGNILREGFHTISGTEDLQNTIMNLLSGKKTGLMEQQNRNIELLFPIRNAVDNIIADLKKMEA
ncbi:hypothetical protein [Enterobacter cloacae complex sp. I2]|uniref:hypothetical protein n=1 Tax=Enterobacter cloacae complex sp. I2 TaxID=2779603 RepID=UPI001867210A|nr:hypothetical protein [Enterobacter cloacae complex sp. I2]MBE3513130.1 hypothetical protein [Enterobacter cloacae complex sp. I2]